MGFEWDDHIALSRRDEGSFDADLEQGWTVGGGVNGGYLLSVIGNAISQTLPGKPDPVSVSAHYLSATTPGPATVSTRVLREGGRFATVAADLAQGAGTRITALATYADLSALPDEVSTTAVEPDIAPRDQCVSNEFAPAELRKVAPLMDRFDLLFDPTCIGWAVGEPSRRGLLQGWFRLKDGRDPDPIELLMVCDALPPVSMDFGVMGWAPTLELTVHVRAVPAPGWVKVSHRTRNIAGGMFEEDCEVWDSAGRLVAQSRQLAMWPRA
ncbi:thioesterase family protein [Nocardioides seonyuensis]|uniref:Thioesterase family protein n=1 Tax=Nocardioides seonyuensis TaxID=2518371 RepID=A0A4V1BLY4_9ACTN|nr:thioesterase family protein [Nocardioides seonyuensis]QBX54482.1 thioesterase family protein [Nocardioides seonyuensis]